VPGLIAICAIWGTTWAVIQVGLRGIPPFSGVALRFAIAGSLLLGFALARRVPLGRQRHEKRIWLVNGLTSFSLSYGIVYWAEQWVPSGLTAILFAVYPLVIALLGHFFLPDERLDARKLVGVLLGFGGIGVIFSEDLTAIAGESVLLGSLVMLLSPVAAAVGSLVVKRWGGAIHPLSLTSIPMLLTGALVGLVAVGVERDATWSVDAGSIGALFYLAVVGSGVSFSIYFWLLQHLPATRLALIAYISPILAVFIGVWRGEPLTGRMLLGAAIVLAGVALAAIRRRPGRTSG
jgi:drug/metabolite transporter (DMT)-like permease